MANPPLPLVQWPSLIDEIKFDQYWRSSVPATAIPTSLCKSSSHDALKDITVATVSRASFRNLVELSLEYGPRNLPRVAWVMLKYGTKRERMDDMVWNRI
jgi:hypothetical protein